MKSSPPSARARAVSPKRKPRSWKNSISTTCRLPPSSPTVSASSPGLRSAKFWYERDELLRKIAEFEDILSSDARVHEIVKTELCAIRDKFADERRTEIVGVSGEVDIEDLIPEETCVYTLTNMGYIKRQSVDTYQTQHRGGKGIKGMTRREEDIAETMFTCSSHDYIMFFTSLGRVYRLKGYEIPEGSRQSRGMNIVNILPLSPDEHVTAMLRVPDFGAEETSYLCMVTKHGIIKRTELDAYKNIRKNGIAAINLDEGDELCWVKLTDGNQKLMIATKKGMSIAFHEADARCIGRTARGVKAITLGADDVVAGMCVLDPEKEGADRHRNRLRQTKRRFQLPHPVARRQGAHQLPYRALWRCGSHHNGRAR